jgi:hypothetical protein
VVLLLVAFSFFIVLCFLIFFTFLVTLVAF